MNSVSEESGLSETEWSATPLPSGDSGSSSESSEAETGLSLEMLDVPRGSSDTVVQPRAAPAQQPARRTASARVCDSENGS